MMKPKGNLNTERRPRVPAPPKAGVSRDSKRRFGCGGKLKKKGSV